MVPLALLPLNAAQGEETACTKPVSYFQSHFATAKNPERFNLEWAACEKEAGNEEGAMSAYERVLIYNPNNLEAIGALAKYYSTNHMDYASRELQETIDNSRLTPQQRQIVTTLLEGEPSLVTTRVSASLSVGYDSNLNFGIPTPLTNNLSEELDSAFHTFSFQGNYVNELEESGGFSFQSNLNLYWQSNYSAHYYDTLYGEIDAGVGYTASNMLLYLPLVYRRMHYLEKDLYEQFGIAPRLTASFGKGLLLNIDLKYLERHYIEERYRDADDRLTNIAAGLYQFYGENYLYAQLKFNRFDARHATSLPFTEYDYFQLFVGGSYEIEDFAIAGIDYQYGHGSYDDAVSDTDPTLRKDDFSQVHLSLQRDLTENLKVIAHYTYAHNSSNEATSSYDKQTASVGLQYHY